MTTDPSHVDQRNETGKQHKRPLLLSLLCFFAWIYYGILTLLFLLGLFYSEWISEVIHQYLPQEGNAAIPVYLLFLGLFLLHGTAFSGVILLWKLRPAGYIIFAVPSILIALFHLFRPDISWASTAVCAILIILFGLYYRMMKRPS